MSERQSNPRRARRAGKKDNRNTSANFRQPRRDGVDIISTPENLDLPLDNDILVTCAGPERSPDSKHKIELLVGGEAVSWTTIVTFQQQIGASVLLMGGIQGVGTHDAHRKKGYSRRVLENALRWMRANGYATSMLYGINRYYPKFGYVKAFPETVYRMRVRDAESVSPAGYAFVDFKPNHLNAILKMYHAVNANRTGVVLRDAKSWVPFPKGVRWTSSAVVTVAVNATGRPVGYIVFDSEPWTSRVIEAGHSTDAVLPDLLYYAARHGIENRVETIEFILPDWHPIFETAAPYGLTRETSWHADGNEMVRMIAIPTALKSVKEELGGRTSGSGSLTLKTNLDTVGLFWRNGELSVGAPARSAPTATMPQWALAQLLYGYRSATALAADTIVRTSRVGLKALNDLFPVGSHFYYTVDTF